MRRVDASRGTVFLEFALIAPLAMMLVLFAADFCRILLAEQQIEIASRVLADIETHYEQSQTAEETPYTGSKQCVANYLMDTLGHPDNTWTMSQVVIKDVPSLLNPLSKAFKALEIGSDDKWIIKLIKAVFKELVNIFLGGTQYYVEDLCCCDRILGATCAVKLKTLFPGSSYAFFSSFEHKNYVYVAQTEYKRNGKGDLDFDHREKHHCYMPIMETLQTSPETWIRMAEKNLGKSFIVSLCKKIGLNFSDYKKEVDE